MTAKISMKRKKVTRRTLTVKRRRKRMTMRRKETKKGAKMIQRMRMRQVFNLLE